MDGPVKVGPSPPLRTHTSEHKKSLISSIREEFMERLMDSQHNYRGRWNRGGRGWRGTARGVSVGQTRGWRGRGQQGNSTSTSTQQSIPHPSKPLGPVVDSITANTLLVELESPTIQDVRYIASYNWASGKDPIILVPGKPLPFSV